jgi:Sulfotransferase domain.
MANTVAGVLGQTEDVHFKNLKSWVGGSEAPPSAPPADGFPTVIGHHRERPTATYLGEDTTVVYVVRHPGDVMESFYDWRQNRWVDMDPGPFTDFIRSENGVKAWARHVRSWQDRWDVLIKFEDLKEDPSSQLRKIWNAADVAVDESTIQYAVDQSSFTNMQRMEEQYGKDDKAGGNPDYAFMRKGESDAGEAYFDAEDRQYLGRIAGDILEPLDYTVENV